MTSLHYPVAGLVHFLVHPDMWCQVLCAVVSLLILFIILFPMMLIYARQPQADVLHHLGLTAWLAQPIAVLLVILETFLTLLITAGVLMASIQDKLFEKTLHHKGVALPGLSDISIRRGLITTLWHLMLNSAVFIFSLPLAAIPLLGPLIFCLAMAVPLAWEQHALLFAANRVPFGEQWRYVKLRISDYLGFGFTCQILGLIPLLNVLTLFTNCVGAALWVADLEKNGHGIRSVDVPPAGPTKNYFPMAEENSAAGPAKEMAVISQSSAVG